jgi:hypothetical protein
MSPKFSKGNRGAVVASPELAARARSIAQRYGLRRTANACGVDRDTLLCAIARWPQRFATIELLRSRLAEFEQRGYGAST